MKADRHRKGSPPHGGHGGNQDRRSRSPRDEYSILLLRKPIREAVVGTRVRITSRSLILDRLADARLKEDRRRKFFQKAFQAAGTDVADRLAKARLQMLRRLCGGRPPDRLRLVSRMVLNSSGGIMENAGICLDRFSGVPYIPGSALKGCARHAALDFLHRWRADGKPPGDLLEQTPGSGTGTIEYRDPEELLVDIALTFGWVEQDWKIVRSGRPEATPDLQWAWGEGYAEIRDRLLDRALAAVGFPRTPRTIPSFRGSVVFLSAWPEAPSSPDRAADLELDVVTCHHRRYYANDPKYRNAPDVEDPVPVVFPVVASGAIFAFGVIPVRRSAAAEAVRDPSRTPEALAEKARQWLRIGLVHYGIGGKTAAGYGWFEPLAEEEDRAEKERDRAAAAEEASLSPEEKLKRELLSMPNDAFVRLLEGLEQEEEPVQRKVLEILTHEKREQWREWRKAVRKDPGSKKRRRIEVVLKVAEKCGVHMP